MNRDCQKYLHTRHLVGATPVVKRLLVKAQPNDPIPKPG